MKSIPKVWIVEVGEPLPLPGAKSRLMRAGQMAERLQNAGADVTWWVSDYSHNEKRYYDLRGTMGPDRSGVLTNGIFARFLHGRPYSRNISISRILHNRDVAFDFSERITKLPRPDAIFCCYPTIDLADEATAFGKAHGVPVILDVRDLWPDAFMDILPLPNVLVRALISPLTSKAKRAFRNSTGISAISEPILNWALEKAGRARNACDFVVPLSYEPLILGAKARADAENQWREHGLQLDGSEKIACWFGNLSDVPEFETVLASIDHLPENILSHLKIVLCGEGSRLSWLRNAAKFRSQIVLPGRVSAEAIASLMPYCFAGLLAYPSRSDLLRSYPNKIGEYLSCGLPVISTLEGTSAKLLRDNRCGIVVPNRNSHAFAVALETLATNPILQAQMRGAALATFHKIFDGTKNYAAMADFLVRMAGANESSVGKPLSVSHLRQLRDL